MNCLISQMRIAWFTVPLAACIAMVASHATVRSRFFADQNSAVQAQAAESKRQSPRYELAVLRGRVVELGPHLQAALQISMDDDAGKNVIALVTDSGEVHPLVKDVRSRGFWLDKRLRDRPMELQVHRFPGVPFVRLIDVYSLKDGKRFRVDYWCTICSITTFQPGPCPCCQDEIELREVLVEDSKSDD